jgi:hypothetical protein
MKSIKIVSKFFTKSSLVPAKAYQRALAKSENRKIHRLHVVEAITLSNSNEFFKSKIRAIGRAVPGDFVIVIYYKAEMVMKSKPTASVKKSKAPIESPNVLKIVKPFMNNISAAAAKSKAIIIELTSFNNTHLIKPTSRIIALHSPLHLPVAA